MIWPPPGLLIVFRASSARAREKVAIPTVPINRYTSNLVALRIMLVHLLEKNRCHRGLSAHTGGEFKRQIVGEAPSSLDAPCNRIIHHVRPSIMGFSLCKSKLS